MRVGLRALAERLGEREEQREHRDQQRDLLVRCAGVLGMLGVFQSRVLGMLSPPLDPRRAGSRAASHDEQRDRPADAAFHARGWALR